MILKNCEWVDEPEQAPVKAPKKRLMTEARVAASRANGAKSVGPITDTGRAKVKFNAVQHGAACKEIVFLPGEDRNAFWAKVDRIVDQEQAQGDLEIEAIKNAAYSRVTKLRAINGQAIAVTESMAKIVDQYDDQKQVEVRTLIPEIAKAPDVTVAKLMNSTRGCAFLIGQFNSLDSRLLTHVGLEVSQREYCLQLAGHRPDELFTDPVVREFNRSYLGSVRGPGGFTIDGAANALMYDRPKEIEYTEFTRRMEPLVSDLPEVEVAHVQLQKFVRDRIERLEERMELMRFREERELNAAVGAAQSPCDREGEKRERYASQSDRTFNAAVRLLLALKQERRKHGDRCQDLVPPADRPMENDPEPAPFPGPTDRTPNEPETTEVVGPPAGNATASAPPVTLLRAVAPIELDPGLAIIEKYRKEIEELTQQHPLE